MAYTRSLCGVDWRDFSKRGKEKDGEVAGGILLLVGLTKIGLSMVIAVAYDRVSFCVCLWRPLPASTRSVCLASAMLTRQNCRYKVLPLESYLLRQDLDISSALLCKVLANARGILKRLFRRAAVQVPTPT